MKCTLERDQKPVIVDRVVLHKCAGSSNKDYVIQTSHDGEFYYVVAGWGKHLSWDPQQTQRKIKTTSQWRARHTAHELLEEKINKGYRMAKRDNQWRIPLRD